MQIWWKKHCSLFKLLLLLCALMLIRIVVHTTVKICRIKGGCKIPGLAHLGPKHHKSGDEDGYDGNEDDSEEDEDDDDDYDIVTTTVDPDLPIIDEESKQNNASFALAYGPITSTCAKRGDLSFYVYYTLWRNDRMPMYVISCTSPRPDGVEYVQAGYNYFTKNNYPPTVRYDDANFDFKYTIVMVDPDSPNRDNANCRYWLHWAVADVEGRSLRNGVNWQSVEGTLVKEYTSPKLEKSNGPHRFQFLLYQQRYPYGPVRVTGNMIREGESRCGFNPLIFARKNRLDIVATAVFETENPA